MEMPQTGDVLFFNIKNGVTPNLTSNSDSPSYIYPKTSHTRFFITWKYWTPAMFFFWNIKNGVTPNMNSNSRYPSFI